MPQFRAPTGELPPARRQARGRHQPRFHPCRCRGHAQAGAPLRQSPRGTCPAADDLDPTTVGVPDATKHPLSSNNSASHLAMPAAAIKQGKPGAKSTAKAPRRCCQASGTPSVRARWSARAKRCPVRNQDRAEGQLAPPESANLRGSQARAWRGTFLVYTVTGSMLASSAGLPSAVRRAWARRTPASPRLARCFKRT